MKARRLIDILQHHVDMYGDTDVCVVQNLDDRHVGVVEIKDVDIDAYDQVMIELENAFE